MSGKPHKTSVKKLQPITLIIVTILLYALTHYNVVKLLNISRALYIYTTLYTKTPTLEFIHKPCVFSFTPSVV